MLEIVHEIRAGDWAIVLATLFGPIFAVQAQKRLELLRERFNRKVWVFSTLLNTRGQRLSHEHVRALNMIDVAFYGSKMFFGRLHYQSQQDKAVVIAWKAYLENLGTDVSKYTEADIAVLNQKRTDLFVDLLWEISKSVGYNFDRVHLQKQVYMPVAHGKQEAQEQQFRELLVEVFSGVRTLKLDIASFPSNPQVAAAYAALVKQLAQATENGRLDVRVDAGSMTS